MPPQRGVGSDRDTVYIRRCEDYDPVVIGRLISEGMAALGYSPSGNLFVKPNVVFASRHPKFGTGAYTHNAVIEAALATMRKLGVLIMGRNPVAVDLVGAHLLGYHRDDVPYLKRAVERGYTPQRLEDVVLAGDLLSIADLDEQARRILPYDDRYTRWQDIHKEFDRLATPLRFFWGHSRHDDQSRCPTGASWA